MRVIALGPMRPRRLSRPRRLGEHLGIHEGAVDAAEHGDDARIDFLGDLQPPLGLA
jgi:hypothetical protein